ncbi:hypothetical protein U2P60_04255 [Brucella sp. H1_1004]
MNRAYSVLNIRTVNEDERLIEGIASTPSADRMDDVVEPKPRSRRTKAGE